MEKRPLRKQYVWIGIAAALLLAVQFVWLHQSYSIAHAEFEKAAHLRMESVVETMEKEDDCFELFARQEIARGEDFFLLAPEYNNGSAQVDTVNAYYWEQPGGDTLFQWGRMSFNAPALVEVSMRFTYMPDLISSDSLSSTEKWVKESYQNSIPITAENGEVMLLDTAVLRETIHAQFATLQQEVEFDYAVCAPERGEVYLASDTAASANLLASAFSAPLYAGERFMQPVALRMYFPSLWWVLLRDLLPYSMVFLCVLISTVIALVLAMRAAQRKKDLAQLKVALINNLTHEFNTPIANISLALDTLAVADGDGQTLSRERLHEIIRLENKRMKQNIDKVLLVPLESQGELNISPSKVDVHELIGELLVSFELLIESKQAQITSLLQAGQSTVAADRTHLANALRNLIDNALKYSPAPALVEIGTRDQQSGIEVYVRDRGIGIERHQQPFIFERFFRAETGNRHDVKGFGLGLHYVKAIVDAHRGSIKVSSSPGKGTTFSVHLPYQINS